MSRYSDDDVDEYREILKLTAEMREYQRRFFGGRRPADMREAMLLEAMVDSRLNDIGIRWP